MGCCVIACTQSKMKKKQKQKQISPVIATIKKPQKFKRLEIILTGFNKWRDVPRNPTEEIVEHIMGN